MLLNIVVRWKILGAVSKGGIENPGLMCRGLWDSRDHVYSWVE